MNIQDRINHSMTKRVSFISEGEGHSGEDIYDIAELRELIGNVPPAGTVATTGAYVWNGVDWEPIARGDMAL